jgi:Tfp pilus assembly protein PilX
MTRRRGGEAAGMTRWRGALGNERGAVLALSMIVLAILTMLAVGLATMGGVESQISANQAASARARLIAEAGIEYAFTSLAAQDFTTKLTAGSTLVAAGTTLPGLSASSGTFGVTIRNDRQTGDTLLTGAAALDPSNSTTVDQNGVVILTSSGTADGATRQILAVIQRGTLGINAAVTLPGLQADTTTDSPCPAGSCPPNPLRNYSIDGRDWRRSDTTSPTGSNPLKLGIATSGSAEATVEAAFSDAYRRGFVQGKHESTGALTTGLSTINSDSTLTPAIIQSFMTNLAANPATQIIQSTQECQFPAASAPRDKPEGLHLSSTGTANIVTVTNNCTGAKQINQTINLGTASSPQMIYFKGEFDPSSNFVGVGVQGSNPIQGYGLMVVEDADLAFFQTGNFRWDGIVLVTGRNVSVAFKGNSNTEVRGALIGNETNGSEPGGYFEFFNRTTGSMVMRASKENIEMALQALYNMRITSYRETCTTSSC